MITKLISQYLATHKRLVIPNLGTFIVKIPNESILFSNLIKTDDGVLRSLLTENGVSQLEAAATVDRFVFEVQYRLQNNGTCRLGGFGELRSGANGTITFRYEPATKAADGTVAEAAGAAAKPVPKPVAVQPQPVREVSESKTVKQPAHETTAAENEVSQQEAVQPAGTERSRKAERVQALYGDRPATTSATASAQTADYVKGLQYGKGRRVPAGREYGASQSNKKKSDIIMIVAIVAATLAIIALAYGWYCDWNSSRMESDMEIYGEPQPSAESTVRNPDLDYIEPYDK